MQIQSTRGEDSSRTNDHIKQGFKTVTVMSAGRSSRFAVATLSLGSCSSHRLEDKLRAAAKVGFRRLELFLPDLEAYIEAHEKGHGVSRSTSESRLAACRELWNIAKELGITFNSLQPLRDVEGILDPVKRRAKFDEVTSYFPICNIFEIDLIFCCSSIQSDASGDVAVISNDLVELADLATEWHKQHGGTLIRIGYEGLSWGAHINKWSQAWHCVNYNPRSNLGLIIDSFNALAREYADPYNAPTGLQRSPAQSVIFLRQHLQHLVSTVPGNRIFLFQIADASMPPKALSRPPSPESGVPRLQPWSRNTRLFPLETERGAYLPVVPYVKAVLATGYQGDWSLEVFNASLHDTDDEVPLQHAKRAYAALTKLDQTLDEATHGQESSKGIERPESPCRVRNSPRSALTPLPPAAAA